MESTSLVYLFNEITTHGVVQRYSIANIDCCAMYLLVVWKRVFVKQPRIRNLSVGHETATY